MSEIKVIKSPMPGTFYLQDAPGNPPFIKVGNQISKGSVVGLVEVMKMFNQIESPYNGEVVGILVDNESLVDADESLIEIRIEE